MASEAGHWYDKDGNPAYTTVAKNGQLRATTLRDARKLGLVPSVTTVMKEAAKPGLTNWIIDQHIMAVLTMPRVDGESEAEYIARIKRDAGAQAAAARERGTQIHAWVQQGFECKEEPDRCWDGYEYFDSARRTLDCEGHPVTWITEQSFATDRYGGKCDLHNDSYLIDIKTSQKPIADSKLWPEHYQQLAAYRAGLFGETSTVRCGILFINTDNADSQFLWAEEERLIKGFRCFSALVEYYYASTGL